MSSFSESVLQDKLDRLTSSQDSIETLSSWILHHRTHASTSVTKWLQNIVHSDKDKQIVLIYLANDVLQNSRRKSLTSFQDLFREPLKHAASLLSSSKNQQAFIKIISLWRERRIYDAIYLNELENYIEPIKETPKKPKRSVQIDDFKLSLLEDSLTELQKFEGEMKVKANALSRLTIDVSSLSSLSQLKDKSSGGKFEAEFEDASKKLFDYHECLGIEVEERKNLMSMLEQCKRYQEEKNKELKSLRKDYENIKKHFEDVQKKLKERVEQLEKAQHTATSDPTSQEDIIVAGDMEIDSDGEDHPSEGQELPLTAVPPILPNPIQPLAAGAPPSFQPTGVPPFPPQGHSVRPPSLPLLSLPSAYNNNGSGPYPAVPVPQSIPPFPSTQSFTTPVPYSPSMPKVFTPRLPLNSPPSHSVQTRPFYTAPVKDNPIKQSNTQSVPKHPQEGENIRGPSPSSMLPIRGPSPSSMLPINPLKPLPPVTSTVTTVSSRAKPLPETSPNSNLDPREKESSKMLPLSLFQDYSDSDSDDDDVAVPYSPSGVPPTAMITAGSVQDDEKESIPTPNMTPPTPDYVTFSTNNSFSIGNNMLNTTPTNNVKPPDIPVTPITINHFKSADLPSRKSVTPIVNDDHSKLSGGVPPHTMATSQSFSEAILNLASSINQTTSVAQQPTSAAVKPENIKITPTFTNLLDKIFPQLSQSLRSERKRKLNDDEPSMDKVPRSDDSSNVVVQQQLDTPITTIGVTTNHMTTAVQSKPTESSDDDLARYEMEIQDIANNTPAPPPPSAPPNVILHRPPQFDPNSLPLQPRLPIHNYPRPMGPRLFTPNVPQPRLVRPPYRSGPLYPLPGRYRSENAALLRPRYY